MKLLKNKRGGSESVLLENIVFIILNVIVFSMLLFFVISQTSGGAVAQEQAAKKIALVIDSMQEGMEVNLTMDRLFELAEKNNQDIDKKLIIIDYKTGLISVSVKPGSTYSYRHFSKVLPEGYSVYIDKKNKQITIKS